MLYPVKQRETAIRMLIMIEKISIFFLFFFGTETEVFTETESFSVSALIPQEVQNEQF